MQYDAEKVSGSTQYFFEHTEKLWELSDLPKKQALQNAIFPTGFYCTKEKNIRTADLSPCFDLMSVLSADDLAFGDPTRIRTGVTGMRTRCPRPLDDGADSGAVIHNHPQTEP